MTIHYQVRPQDIGAHVFAVRLDIAQPDPAGQQLQLPVWIPGSYLIREFARNVVQIQAQGMLPNGQLMPLNVQKLNKSSWKVAPFAGAIHINYEVYAFDLSVRGAYLDQTRAFFNGTSVCLQVLGAEQQAHQLSLAAGSWPADDWQVATGLTAIALDEQGFGRYQAANYDELIDCPVEIAPFSDVRFTACGVPHRLVISGRHQADLARLAQDLKAICEYQIRLFGEPAPFNDYTFMTVAVGDGYGGLEHRNSTALICSRGDLPKIGETEQSTGYRQFLGLCSHEYFHSWNVKRIKPAVFAPYDLQQENYTRLLWAFEGITSYYDDLTLLRTGLIDWTQYLQLLAQTATQVERGYGAQRQTLEDSSLDTWVKYYRQDENAPNELVSYYTKGALVAFCLDMHIRQHTHNQRSLDDVMQLLWARYGRDFGHEGVGVGEAQWEALACEASGLDLSVFFDRALRSTQPLPLAESLAYLGIDSQCRPALNAQDKGGWQDTLIEKLSWGVRYSADPAGIKLTHVLRGEAAATAGLAAGDVIVAVDHLRVNAAQFDGLQQVFTANTPVQIHAFRRDELLQLTLLPQKARCDTWGFRLKSEAGQAEEINRNAFVIK
ncbi:M61 family metallopeptidase [Chitinibacter sp. ZOR0017]|uniref:M61 family metallopeptidase n=1 Tax=Chitinibacter sp. ZOR0017 TaxID=1339254 RepID=UPI000645588D|nr:M61 family metallopeptidase [Chitinibacter sp. ZOR0017]